MNYQCPKHATGDCNKYETSHCPASANGNDYDWEGAGMGYQMGISECVEWRFHQSNSIEKMMNAGYAIYGDSKR